MGDVGEENAVPDDVRGQEWGTTRDPVREECIRGFAWESPGIIQDQPGSLSFAQGIASRSPYLPLLLALSDAGCAMPGRATSDGRLNHSRF